MLAVVDTAFFWNCVPLERSLTSFSSMSGSFLLPQSQHEEGGEIGAWDGEKITG